ncbi:MAG: hypothetical protein WAW02_15725 [Sideroxyarcus sp.]
MDERAIKRLLVILAISIIAIFLFKAMMTNTFVNLNKAAAEKQQAAAIPPAAQQEEIPVSDVAVVIEAPAASSVGEAQSQEPSAQSGVSGVQ